jgi:phosphatidylserine decarboxylase
MRIAREAWPFFVGCLTMAAAALLLHPLVAAIPFAGAAFTLWFFRDPERETPDDPDALFSPADGRVLKVVAGEVSVFLNVFDVHICRAPIAGTVEGVEHVPGRFLAAFRDEASTQNERVIIGLVRGGRSVRLVLIAGLVARRIVCKVAAGQALAAGERVGLIRFGSRADVTLPEGFSPRVRRGDRVVAGVTVLARHEPTTGG